MHAIILCESWSNQAGLGPQLVRAKRSMRKAACVIVSAYKIVETCAKKLVSMERKDRNSQFEDVITSVRLSIY